MLIHCLTTVACGPGPEAPIVTTKPEASDSTITPSYPAVAELLREPQEIPFCNFADRSAVLKFDFARLVGVLHTPTDNWALPDHTLPMQVLGMADGSQLAFLRGVFSGDFSCVRRTSGLSRPVVVPPRLQNSLFREAACYRDRAFVVLYNVVTHRNVLHRLLPTADGGLQWDDAFQIELSFGGRYSLDSKIHLGVCRDVLFLASEDSIYLYDEHYGLPNLAQRKTKPNARILEMAVTPQAVFGLYQAEASPVESSRTADLWYVLDLDRLVAHSFTDEAEGIPFQLTLVDGKHQVSWATSNKSLADLFEYDLRRMESGALMSLGINNSEGRVAWSQVYYLNGLIDLMSQWPVNKIDFRHLSRLRPAVQRRLQMEIYLLLRMLQTDPQGLACRRYCVDRQPATFAVQSGRILRTCEHYVHELKDIDAAQLEQLRRQVLSLTGHLEKVGREKPNDPYTTAGRRHLYWPKGSAFSFDGTQVPFNHQNDWAAAVAAVERRDELGVDAILTAKDIVEIFLDTTGVRSRRADYASTPSFQWDYNWGRARAGWKQEDAVSLHRPSYDGDKSSAHISYRTIDAMAVMAVARHFSGVMSPELLGYFQQAVEREGIYLFAAAELIRHDCSPRPPKSLLLRYVRPECPAEIQNAVWAHGFLAIGAKHRLVSDKR